MSSKGFSLVELMIAIMILGLGMVMAATIFPVSIDMTRGTVQLNISETAADAAAATLALRLPRYKDLTPDIPGTAIGRVALPGMEARELVGNPPAHLDDKDLLVSAPTLPGLYDPTAPFWTTDLKARVRIYTEMSFWDAEYVPPSVTLPSFVTPAQNLQPDPANPGLVRVFPEMPPLSGSTFPRISIVDRVYPPVDLYDMEGGVRPVVAPPMAPLPGVLDEAATRRYSWTAIHFRDLNDEAQKTFFTRIVVLFRANTNARYAKQNYPPADPYIPEPAPDATTDTLFPQAWLVVLNSVDGNGIVTCSPHVSRLLPVGSYFILAQGSPPGAYTKVLKNTWDGGALAALQIKPGSFPSGSQAVWVFPPALLTAPNSSRLPGNIQFETTSPVVDVVPKKVIAG